MQVSTSHVYFSSEHFRCYLFQMILQLYISVIRVVMMLFLTCSLGAEDELLLRVAPSKLVPGPDLDPVHGGLAQPGDGVQAPGHPAPGAGLLVPRHSGVQGVGVPGVQQRLVQSLKRRLIEGSRRLA